MKTIAFLFAYRDLSRRFAQHLTAMAVIGVGLSSASARSATELLRNGSFNDVLVDWTLAEPLADWLPYQHPAGNITLRPDTHGYKGVLLSQSLNVTGIANEQVDASIDLQTYSTLPAGNTFALYIEYLDNTGTLQRAKLINPDDSAIPDMWHPAATFSASFTFPANASKLVRLTIEKETTAYAEALLDNVHLMSGSLTPGEVPHIQSLVSNSVAYPQSVVISGSGFGGVAAPVVLLNGSSSGITVNSWTATTINVTVNSPAASGYVSVAIAGTPSVERRTLQITSPHFVVAIPQTTYYAVPAQEVGVNVQVAFRSGFAPTAPGVQLEILKGGVAFAGASFSPSNVPRTGGSLLSIDTTGLAAGQHTFQVRASYDGVVQDSFFDLFIEVPVNLRLMANYSIAPSPLNIHTQERVSLSANLLDADGHVLTATPTLLWSSSNESFFKVFTDRAPWGGTSLLVKDNGDANLHINGPGGLHYQFPISINAPPSPRVVSFQIGQPIVDNSGLPAANTLYYLFTEPLTNFSWSYNGYMSLVLGDGTWGDESRSFTGLFHVTEGQAPGQFLMFASSNGITAFDVLTVVNDPTKGMLAGHVASFGASSGGEMIERGLISGTLEFYQSDPNKPAFIRDIYEWSDTYHAAYVAPGSYKVRWVARMGGLSQWYPLATSYADAATIDVTAGTTIPNIDFFLTAPDIPLPPPVMAGAPSHDSVAGTFGIPILTEEGSYYQLQRSDSMLEGSWFNVGSQWSGDGSAQTLEDDTATGPKGFYRVIRK